MLNQREYVGDEFAVSITSKKSDDMIPLEVVRDYGIPAPDQIFFDRNRIHEFSAQRLVYSCFVTPGIEQIANTMARKFFIRGEEELQHIKTAKDVETLLSIMKNISDTLNHEALVGKLVIEKDQSIPLILRELHEPQQDHFVEIAVRVFHRSGIDCSRGIIDILKGSGNRQAYSISLFCMLLGFFENKESEKLLWDYYHSLKLLYPNSTYADGPLLGLIEMRERRKEKVALN